MTDFIIVDEGSLVGLNPVSREAQQWLVDHLPEECPRLGCVAYVRTGNATDILIGINADGLTWELK